MMLIIPLLMVSCPFKIDDETQNGEYASAMEFAASMKIGWNLGNTLDGHNGLTPNETRWQSVITTQALLTHIKNEGFGVVRIPVTWGTMLHEQLKNNPGNITLSIAELQALKIDQTWLNRVAEVVNYAKNAGLKAIINIHHDGADSYHWFSVKNADLTGNNKEKIDAIFVNIWTQLAQRFINEGNYLIFEGFNELHDGSWGNGNTAQRNRINELNQLFVDTVRSVGGENSERYLLIHGWVTRPSITVSNLVMPNDPTPDRIMVGIHYYDPYDFSGSAEWDTWGSKSLTGANGWANETHLRNTFDNVKARFIDNGIPVILGEYGAVRQRTATGKAHRLYYMEYVTKYAIDCGFVPVYWDNGSSPNGNGGREQFGLYNRTTRAYANDAIDVVAVLMKAAYENYSITSITAP